MTDEINKTEATHPPVAKEPPDWMRDTPDDGFAEYLAAVEPVISIEYARFGGAFPSNPKADGSGDDHLTLLIQAAFLQFANNIPEWREYLESFPSQPLSIGQTETAQNPDVQVRAHFLKQAMTRLLQLVNAPEAMISDLQAILDCHKPRAADVRAHVQAEWCEDDASNLRSIAKKLGRDHRQLYKDRDAGLIVKPSHTYEPTRKSKRGS